VAIRRGVGVAAKRRWAAAAVPSVPTARVNGITMYYEQHGAGEPLLLINGLGADITLLAPIIAWFERSFRVVAFDNRGAGRTDKPDAPCTIELMAQDTAALMDVLSLERADVLGVSMGGRVALELALSCPDRVGRLVLVSTSAAGRGKVTVSWPVRLLLPLRWAGLLRGKYPQPRYAYLRQRQASASYDATDRLGDIRVPALILHGRRDRSMPADLAKRMLTGIPGSRIEFFRGGHMFFLFAERQQFLDQASRFLAR
jgi:3-oxoadipate enol-lactonase